LRSKNTQEYCRWKCRLIFTLTFALLISLSFTAEAETIQRALNIAEVKLLSDSSEANNWVEYGWALWGLSEMKAHWAFSRALHEHPEYYEANRGLAAIASAGGEFESALEFLDLCEATDTLSLIMRISLLQHTGNLVNADQLLSTITYTDSNQFFGFFHLLNARQARLSGDSLVAAHLLALDTSDIEDSSLLQIIRLELILLQEDELTLNSSDILEALRVDISCLGCVYVDTTLSFLEMLNTPDPFLPARIIHATGDYEAAYKAIPRDIPAGMKQYDMIWLAELLMRLDRYSEAMDYIDLAIMEDSTIAAAWRLKGVLLLRGYQNYEAYEVMQTALLLTDNSPECRALAGLAAELEGESILSVETYAPLLAISSDSVVLINRLRQLIYDDDLNYNFDYEERDCFSNTRTSWLNGEIGFDYSRSTGEIEQSRLGISADAQHHYGLYGSVISASASYSLRKWPGEGGKQEICNASISALHRSTSKYYGTIGLAWEQRRYDVNRWKLGISAGIGRRFCPITALSINVNPGIGGVINRWDIETDYEVDWVANATLYSQLNGQMFSNYLPILSASICFTQQLRNLSRYDIRCDLQLQYYTSRFVSFSLAHSIEYLSSIPPDYEDICNTDTSIQLRFHF